MKMDYNLDKSINKMLNNLDLIPEMIDPDGFQFFGSDPLNVNTAKIYQLICNISNYHESTSESIRWLCIHLNLHTDINHFPIQPTENIYLNVKSYILDPDNRDEETGAYWVLDNKYQEHQYLNELKKVESYGGLLLLNQKYGLDIYESAEVLASAALGDITFTTPYRNNSYERPLIAAIVYAKLVAHGVLPSNIIKNLNPDNL